MTAIAPERSLDQRMEALKRANEIRSFKAEIKQDLKAGRRSLRGLLIEPPADLATAKIAELLRAVPGCGPEKTKKILQHCRISPSKTLGGLSQRQRVELAARLPARPLRFLSFASAPSTGTDPNAQHMRALSDANQVRLARSRLKARVDSGEVAIADALGDPAAASMSIADLLAAQHRWGETRVKRLLGALNIAENKAVCTLTARQRTMITRALVGEPVDPTPQPAAARPPARRVAPAKPASEAPVAVVTVVNWHRARVHLRFRSHQLTLCRLPITADKWVPGVPGEWADPGRSQRCVTCEVVADGRALRIND